LPFGFVFLRKEWSLVPIWPWADGWGSVRP
jgi:hypothetical protein